MGVGNTQGGWKLGGERVFLGRRQKSRRKSRGSVPSELFPSLLGLEQRGLGGKKRKGTMPSGNCLFIYYYLLIN